MQVPISWVSRQSQCLPGGSGAGVPTARRARGWWHWPCVVPAVSVAHRELSPGLGPTGCGLTRAYCACGEAGPGGDRVSPGTSHTLLASPGVLATCRSVTVCVDGPASPGSSGEASLMGAVTEVRQGHTQGPAGGGSLGLKPSSQAGGATGMGTPKSTGCMQALPPLPLPSSLGSPPPLSAHKDGGQTLLPGGPRLYHGGGSPGKTPEGNSEQGFSQDRGASCQGEGGPLVCEGRWGRQEPPTLHGLLGPQRAWGCCSTVTLYSAEPAYTGAPHHPCGSRQ